MVNATQPLRWAGGGGVSVPCSCIHGQCYATAGGGGWRGFAVDQDEHVEHSCNNSPFGSSEKACEIPS